MTWNIDRGWMVFKDLWYKKSKIDLNLYKQAQMYRRINAFIARNEIRDYETFLVLLDKDAKLYKNFVDHLTINVTEFFRTLGPFDELATVVLPILLKKYPSLNIWSAGCSMGAEPYSLAITLHKLSPKAKHRILATDIDIDVLKKAQAGGPYLDYEMKNVEKATLDKYFVKTSAGYMIVDEIRKKVEFRQHNLLKDNFEKKFDLILCRNVVIYFTEKAKECLYKNFYESLKSEGFLFVGGTEAIINFRTLGYRQIRPFFYQKK